MTLPACDYRVGGLTPLALAFAAAMQVAPVAVGPMNHVALPTANPVQGAQFYCRVLGFIETPRPSFSFRGSWLLHPRVGVMIHLIHDESFSPPGNVPINTRASHLAMQVDDYAAAVSQLAAHGVEYVERVLPDYGYRQAFFRDPDGNVLELGEWPSPGDMFPQYRSGRQQ